MAAQRLSSDVDLMTRYNLSNNLSPKFATSSGILRGSVKVFNMLSMSLTDDCT